MATIGRLKETGKKYYLYGPFYINGEEFWSIPSLQNKKFRRNDFEEGLPTIPRDEFLRELKELFIKYNASIEVSYEETCVWGDPTTISVYVDDYQVMNVEGSELDENSIKL